MIPGNTIRWWWFWQMTLCRLGIHSPTPTIWYLPPKYDRPTRGCSGCFIELERYR